MKIDLSCPVELNSIVLNKETQTAELNLFNLSQQTITAMKYSLVLFDTNGEEIQKTQAELEGINFPSQDSFKTVVAAENAANIDVIFTEITFEGETVFVPDGKITNVSFEKIQGTELNRIKRAGAEDGICYSKEEKDYWLCVCSRPNILTSENCIKCNRSKDEVLKKFASEENVALTILNKEDSEAASLKEEKAATKEKTLKVLKKSSLIAAIIIAALLICFFAFRLIVTSIGNSSAKAGDYKKAYSMYKLAGGKNIDKIANKVYGNTSTNLETLDLIAQDDNNIYFTDTANIYKQDKTTGEQSVLKDVSAHSLNISGDFIYYINLKDESKIYKISSDGKTNEAVSNVPAYGIFTVFNDVYFISATAAEGTNSQMPVYVLKEGKAEPELVLDADVQVFSIYGDKIYYTDSSDNLKLKSANLSGGKSKTLIDTSVYEFVIKGGKIYYTDGGDSDDTPLSLETADLNGNHIETLIDNAIITMFSISDDVIYYSDYNNQGTLYKKENGKDAEVVAESAAVVNVDEGAVFYYSYDSSFHISKPDKSGFDLVKTQNDQTPSETAETTDETASPSSPAENEENFSE